MSIGPWLLSCRGLLQYRLHSRLKRFGRHPPLSRFNLLARQLRFQFSAQLFRTMLGLLIAGGMVQGDQQQLKGSLHFSALRPQTCYTNECLEYHRHATDFSRDA